MNLYKYEQMRRYNQFLLILSIVVVAFNLRAAITSVGPVIGMIRETLALPNWSIGILTSLPFFSFALMSPVAPKLGVKFSNEVVLVSGMVVLAVGVTIRSIAMPSFLFAGTLLLGLGIAVSNVLLPGIIKERFPKRESLMTSVYATAMSLSAAFASGITIPLAKGAGLGWQLALGIWIVPALLAGGMWFYFVKTRKSANQVRMKYYTSKARMWQSPLAWQVALFMGMQAFLYNVVITWLPEMLADYGISEEEAGWMLSLNQFIGLPVGLLVPIIAGKITSQKRIVSILCALSLLGFGGLLIGMSYTVMFISVMVMGISLGGLFPLALTFLGLRAKTAQEAAELSGMAQAVGYFLAATGPIIMGSLLDATGNWNIAFVTLMVITAVTWIVGIGAGRGRVVSDDLANMKNA